ncbi:MAG: hypothetical protein M1828_007349 [Chrysothrix sp. TS-e1954]|nr:MAG: hypothetical protein M1828_007349 [Chrysothrix sp. TS-e1954]
MNPHQRNKVDVSSLTPEEQKLFRLYGKLPNKKDLLQNKLKVTPLPSPSPPLPALAQSYLVSSLQLTASKERKYFDSGDYALSKAGKSTDGLGGTQLGVEHPNPDNIPHLSSSPHSATNNGSSSHNPSIDAAQQPGQRTSVSGGSGSPVKEGSFLHREQSIDDQPGVEGGGSGEVEEGARTVSPPGEREGVPIMGRKG